MPKQETFAGRLMQLRKGASLSKYELAKRTGLSAQAISKLESGAAPSWDTVRRLAYALYVSVNVFEVGPVLVPDAARWGDQAPYLTEEDEAALDRANDRVGRQDAAKAPRRPVRPATGRKPRGKVQ
jgi:transcriptional regulator with XRE-family HTH domain